MLVVCCCPQSWCGFSFAQPWRLVLLPVVRACVCSSPEGLGGAVHNCQNVMSKSHCRGGHCMLSNMRHGACRLSVEGRPQGDTTAEHAVLARVMPQQACSRCAVDIFTVNTRKLVKPVVVAYERKAERPCQCSVTDSIRLTAQLALGLLPLVLVACTATQCSCISVSCFCPVLPKTLRLLKETAV
ncbi:hypothetical protein COO60DRAFT_426867 [Scenedesmus sp. NREL 46B-D3]|nr:hypothetical protein COO60DRAFT_426867 [Scenedesmus sp. NREL 46B-D3]